MTQEAEGLALRMAERRATHRFEVENRNQVMVIAGARSFRAEILDISRGGLRLELEEDPPLCGSLLIEHMSAGFFRARRVWSEGRQLSVAFEEQGSDLMHTLRCIRLLMATVEPQDEA